MTAYQHSFLQLVEVPEHRGPALHGHTWLGWKEDVLYSSVNEACSDLYSLETGRPVKNTPEMMFRSSVIQYLNDFSDRQMEEATRYNLIIKWFIGIPVEDSSYDHSALGDFRDRLGEKRWKKLFFMILERKRSKKRMHKSLACIYVKIGAIPYEGII